VHHNGRYNLRVLSHQDHLFHPARSRLRLLEIEDHPLCEKKDGRRLSRVSEGLRLFQTIEVRRLVAVRELETKIDDRRRDALQPLKETEKGGRRPCEGPPHKDDHLLATKQGALHHCGTVLHPRCLLLCRDQRSNGVQDRDRRWSKVCGHPPAESN
jgi:hypothetical protein